MGTGNPMLNASLAFTTLDVWVVDEEDCFQIGE
jgi:hypothetical protein